MDEPHAAEHPARDVDTAGSRMRRSWGGHGQFVRVEKSAVGRFLHDTVRVFGDVSVPAVPVIFGVTGMVDAAAVALGLSLLAGWGALVATATLVCGGWIGVPLTPRRGWLPLSTSPSLWALRLVVFNAALLVAAFGGDAVASVAGPAGGALVAAAVGAATALVVPALAEHVYDAVEG